MPVITTPVLVQCLSVSTAARPLLRRPLRPRGAVVDDRDEVEDVEQQQRDAEVAV